MRQASAQLVLVRVRISALAADITILRPLAAEVPGPRLDFLAGGLLGGHFGCLFPGDTLVCRNPMKMKMLAPLCELPDEVSEQILAGLLAGGLDGFGSGLTVYKMARSRLSG